MRVGVIHDWKSNWYTGTKEFPAYLLEDIKIREHIQGKLSHAGLSDILIRKDAQRITIDIYTARPGIVIGKSGVEVDALRKEVHGMTNKAVHININEIKRPELDAKLVAQSIAEQLENRVSFRRAMKRSLASAIRSGAQGVKVQCGGRLAGTEMSRSESYSEGRVPLHTIRADIDYGFAEAKTTYGRIGVKVWINKGEIMPEGFESVGQQDRGSATRTRLAAAAAPPRVSARPARAAAAAGPTAKGSAPCARGARRGRRRGRRRDRARGQDNVERPRTDKDATSAEGREQPPSSRRRSAVPEAVAEAPDTTTTKKQVEDPTKLEKPAIPRPRRSRQGAGSKPTKKGRARMLLPKKTKFRKYQRGRRRGDREGPDDRAGRRLRPEGARGRLGDEPPDRGCPNRDDAQDPPRRQGLDQRLPGQAGHAEAGRDAHGLGQGRARALGRGRQARTRDVRARRRRRAPGEGGAPARGPEAAAQDASGKAGGRSLCELESCET